MLLPPSLPLCISMDGKEVWRLECAMPGCWRGEVAWESPLRWWWWHKHSLITISSWENNHPFWQSLFYLFFKERSCFNDSRSSKSFNRLIIFQCEFANHAHQRKPNAIPNKGMETSWNHWDVCVCDFFNCSFTSWNLIALSTSSYLRHAVLW